MKRAKMLWTVAGFDPSGGAGILADLRVFGVHKLPHQAVCTALTIQNEKEFLEPGWVSQSKILAQLSVLARCAVPTHVKIGLIQNPRTLATVVHWFRKEVPEAYLLWDPILRASAGFSFHEKATGSEFAKVLPLLDCITPNLPEVIQLAKSTGALAETKANGGRALSRSFGLNVVLKGGHGKGDDSVDVLFQNNGRTTQKFTAPRLRNISRHGSGCTLSASLLSHLALNNDLPCALGKAKQLVHAWLKNGVYKKEA